MKNEKFRIEYFNKRYLNSQLPKKDNAPFFQLSYDERISGCGGDPHETSSTTYTVIANAKDFPTLTLDVLKFLKDSFNIGNTYSYEFIDDTIKKTNEVERSILEEILLLHNDFVTPRRT
jgi:hypothetical protein